MNKYLVVKKAEGVDNRAFKKKYNNVINVLNSYPLTYLDGVVVKNEFAAAGFKFDNDCIIRFGNLQLNITYILNVLSFEKLAFDNNIQSLYTTPKLTVNERLASFLTNRSDRKITIEINVIDQLEKFGNKTGLFRTLTTTHQIQPLK